ncbi:hypothetical protein JI735_12490 [Paenibacillus sonchi]|uniref:Uncharacterized protein n=1 Tax=Paenibacillus sonchi TaxID=373687 RepID=A0A974PG22_9BACL|nr:hypothetical protein [Paenibacillus sonchi]QQZ63225.1 hypothetical protein JI735_12490 [Paenibacillus sonchi]
MELEERQRPPLCLDFYRSQRFKSRKSKHNSGRKSKHSPELPVTGMPRPESLFSGLAHATTAAQKCAATARTLKQPPSLIFQHLYNQSIKEGFFWILPVPSLPII